MNKKKTWTKDKNDRMNPSPWIRQDERHELNI